MTPFNLKKKFEQAVDAEIKFERVVYVNKVKENVKNSNHIDRIANFVLRGDMVFRF